MTETNWRIIELRDGRERVIADEEFNRQIFQTAGMMRELGLSGKRVSVLIDNSIESFLIRRAAARIGAFTVNVNYHFTAAEVRYILENSGSAALFAGMNYLETAASASTGNQNIGDRRFTLGGSAPGWRNFAEEMAAAAPWTEEPETLTGNVIYTSGTTGNPKGVVRPPADRERIEESLTQFREVMKVGWKPVHLVTGPLYHSGPSGWAAQSFMLGGRIIIMARFDAEEVLRAIEKYKVTNMHLVPTMMSRMLDLPEEVKNRYDLSSLIAVQHGAAPCPPHVKQAMIQWWGPVIDEYYGSTEAGIVTYLEARDALRKPTSVGRPIDDGVEIRILGPDDETLPVGEVGDIYVRNRPSGEFSYHEAPEKTAGSKKEGWFTNGDMGWLDEEGFLHLSDRRADMIISGGVNIYPAEIEAVLHSHPQVFDCAVFGIPGGEWGEMVHAHVQPEKGAVLTPKDITGFLAEHLARYKLPRSVEFTDHLPRQPNGKIYKRKIREQYWQDQQKPI